jgi:hypothetical protein
VLVTPKNCRSWWAAEQQQIAKGEVKRYAPRYPIIASGLMGGKLGTISARAGHEVVQLRAEK